MSRIPVFWRIRTHWCSWKWLSSPTTKKIGWRSCFLKQIRICWSCLKGCWSLIRFSGCRRSRHWRIRFLITSESHSTSRVAQRKYSKLTMSPVVFATRVIGLISSKIRISKRCLWPRSPRFRGLSISGKVICGDQERVGKTHLITNSSKFNEF